MTRKYIRQCRQLFPVYGKYERLFLKRLQNQITEHLSQHPNITYEELLLHFGSPKEIVLEYYDTVDDDYLLNKTNLVRTVRKFCLIISLLFITYLGYLSYIIYQARLEAKDSIIIYEETTIEDFGSEIVE